MCGRSKGYRKTDRMGKRKIISFSTFLFLSLFLHSSMPPLITRTHFSTHSTLALALFSVSSLHTRGQSIVTWTQQTVALQTKKSVQERERGSVSCVTHKALDLIFLELNHKFTMNSFARMLSPPTQRHDRYIQTGFFFQSSFSSY